MDFNELSKQTLEKIRSFGIKIRTVIKCFRRTCRLLREYLEEHRQNLTAASAAQWLAAIKPYSYDSYRQYVSYLGHCRTTMLLLEMQSGKLTEWKTYCSREAERPVFRLYIRLDKRFCNYDADLYMVAPDANYPVLPVENGKFCKTHTFTGISDTQQHEIYVPNLPSNYPVEYLELITSGTVWLTLICKFDVANGFRFGDWQEEG